MGEGDSPSLTSGVVADTKCRQEVVEVISRPWEGQEGGVSGVQGRQWGHRGHQGLTSGVVRSGGGLPRGSEGSVRVLGDVRGLPHRPGLSTGMSGDTGGLSWGLGDNASPTRCSTALQSSSAGGLQPTMLSQMPTMCWHYR